MKNILKKTGIFLILTGMAFSVINAAESPDLLQSALSGDLPAGDIENEMSTANVIAWILFGAIGLAFFMYGKKMSNMKLMLAAAVIIAYPYLVHNTVLLYLIGTVLSIFAFMLRK